MPDSIHSFRRAYFLWIRKFKKKQNQRERVETLQNLHIFIHYTSLNHQGNRLQNVSFPHPRAVSFISLMR